MQTKSTVEKRGGMWYAKSDKEVSPLEFYEKLQELRKQRGLTQEQLAEALYVSRTAVSKWESGRGYPTIDSLKRLATLFAVTVDDLLSGSELLTVAEENTRQSALHLRDLVFGLLDISVAMTLFLPFFGQKTGEAVRGVSLLALTANLKSLYLVTVAVLVIIGVLTLALQTCRRLTWMRVKSALSLLLSTVGTALFIVGQQPYAAVLLFVFLVIKAVLLIKHP
jgi:transcriptional regulator with XRE-family HTH domain